MSDIPSFPYAFLWGERRVVSVANLTREDGAVFMRVAAQIRLQIKTTTYVLGDASRALDDLRSGKLTGRRRAVDRITRGARSCVARHYTRARPSISRILICLPCVSTRPSF